jgi:hypothetical protein
MILATATAWCFRPSTAFILSRRGAAWTPWYRVSTTTWDNNSQPTTTHHHHHHHHHHDHHRRAFLSTSSMKKGNKDIEIDVMVGVSRIETLQKMLASHGAPGSVHCSQPDDLIPIFVSTATTTATTNIEGEGTATKTTTTATATEEYDDEIPELISSIMGMNEYDNLHPHLYPLAKSKTTGTLICALIRSFASDDAMEWKDRSSSSSSSSSKPWPIVESRVGSHGMRLLALDSEHLMRRIVCECDHTGQRNDLIDLYNGGLERKENPIHNTNSAAPDQPYEVGSVAKLG